MRRVLVEDVCERHGKGKYEHVDCHYQRYEIPGHHPHDIDQRTAVLFTYTYADKQPGYNKHSCLYCPEDAQQIVGRCKRRYARYTDMSIQKIIYYEASDRQVERCRGTRESDSDDADHLSQVRASAIYFYIRFL